MFDPESLHAARERDGAAADDRPEDVDDVMSPREVVGYGTEASLLDCGYDEYPDGEDLYRPSMGDTLRSLVEHDMVESAEDIADELNTDVKTVRRAADRHGIDLPDGSDFDVEVDTARLYGLLGAEWPDELIAPDNPVTVATLYVEYGLSTEEVSAVLEEVTDYPSVPERVVRQTLVDTGVLDGTTTDEQQARMDRTHGRGLTVSVEDH